MEQPYFVLDPRLALPGALRAALPVHSVLLAGAPDENLVSRLRAVGFDAWGISAAGQRDPGERRAWMQEGNLLAPLDRSFDLALSLAGLAGLPDEQLATAIGHLCAASDRVLLAFDQFERPPGSDEDDISHLNPVLDLLAGHGFHLEPGLDPIKLTPLMFLYTRQGVLSKDERRQYEIRVITFANKLRKYRLKINQQQKERDSLHESYFLKFLQRYSRIEQRLFPGRKPVTRLAGSLVRFALDSYRRTRTAAGKVYRRLKRLSISRPLGTAGGAYERWMRENTADMQTLTAQKKAVETFDHPPLVSFITPVYNPPVNVLSDTVQSVLAQTYPHWELCLADASTDPAVGVLLADFAAQDVRIRVRRLEGNLGISGNSNAAIEMASGEFIAILDHDDVLAPDMLFEVVRRVHAAPDVDVIYFDEDKLSADGRRRMDPFFKPDWSPEMLIAANYLTHAVYRRSLIELIGPFDPALDGAQDWDLALRAGEQTGRIEHIPKILYHWRQVHGSTAGRFEAKDWVFENQKASVARHLQRQGLENPEVLINKMGRVRVKWSHLGERVSIIIPSRDNVDFLRRTIESIRQMTVYPDYEIIIVDNESAEPETHAYYAELDSESRILFVNYAERFNYSRANNLGAAIASGKYLLFLNNDIEILEPDWLDELVRWAERPGLGVVGTKLLFPDGTIQHAGVILGMEGHASHVFYGGSEHAGGIFGSVDWYRNFSAVTGACMLMPRQVYDRVGGFDEKYELVFSDIEICLRVLKSGLRILYTPYARIRHFEGKSRGALIPRPDIEKGVHDFLPFVRVGDPFFNPNLSHTLRMPSLRAAEEADPVQRLLDMA